MNNDLLIDQVVSFYRLYSSKFPDSVVAWSDGDSLTAYAHEELYANFHEEFAELIPGYSDHNVVSFTIKKSGDKYELSLIGEDDTGTPYYHIVTDVLS